MNDEKISKAEIDEAMTQAANLFERISDRTNGNMILFGVIMNILLALILWRVW